MTYSNPNYTPNRLPIATFILMDNSVNKYLLDRAIPLGLCEPWQRHLATASLDQMLVMYKKGIDFSLSKDFPSNPDLKRIFGRDRLNGHGIYVDSSDVFSVNAPITVLLGNCTAHMDYSGFSASRLFVKHKSACYVTASGNAYVDIDCFDNATVHVTTSDNATVRVTVYGNARVTATGLGVRIVKKNKKTY